jgi:fibronectin-binding autotransporter adhesin
MRQNTSERSARRRRFLALAVAAAGAGLAARSAVAAVVAYDSDANAANGATDGTGLWNTTTANWYNASTATDVFFPGTYADTAVFGAGGTAGTVTVGTVSTGNIAFNAVTGSYTLTGGTISLLNASSAAPYINLSSGVSATINSNLTGTDGLNINTSGGTLTLGGAGVTTGQALGITAGTLNFSSGSSYNGGTGSLNLNPATAPTTATVNINSTGLFQFPSVNVGTGGVGTAGNATLNVSGGATFVSNGNFYVGRSAGGTGNVYVANSTLTVTGGTISFGQNGSSTLTLAGTAVFRNTGTNDFSISASNTNSVDVATVGDSASLQTAGTLYVGNQGHGTLNITSANASVVAKALVIGNVNQSTGVISQAGGALNTTSGSFVFGTANGSIPSVGLYVMGGGVANDASDFQVGYTGYGAVFQSAGTVNVTGYPSLGRGSALGYGVADISGGTFNQANAAATFNVGEKGTGVLSVRGAGTLNAVGGIMMAENSTGTGEVNLLAGGTINTPSVNKGTGSIAPATATFDFNGGTLATTAAAKAVFMGGLDAAYVYAGGAVVDTTLASATITQPLLAPGGQGVASVAVSGGTGFKAEPIVQISGGGGNGASGVATIDASGNLTGITVTNPGTGYTSTPSVTLYAAGGGAGYTFTPTLAANATTGGLTKLGTNTLTLTGTSTYAGATTVSAGTLRVNGALLAAGSVSVQSGATLGGNGSVGAVTVAGTIAAGPDAVTVGNLSTGAQAWTTGGTFLDKFAGDNSANDVLVMTGLTNSASSFTVNLSGANASSASGTFVLAVDTGAMTADPFVTSSLTLTVNGSAAPAGYSLAEQPDTTGQGGVDLVLAATPEPTSLALVTAIAAPLLATRRRRRAVPATVVA